MKIYEDPLLTTISRSFMYRTAEWVQNQTTAVYRSVLDNVFLNLQPGWIQNYNYQL
jgi:hypothetical protein